MKTLTTDPVWGELLRPALRALETVRYPAQRFRVLSMADFLTLGVLRHVQRWPALREQVQAVLHLADDEVKRPPLARSTGSDALASPERRAVLDAAWPAFLAHAQTVLPDRLRAIPGLGDRPVYAADGTYQPESPHYPRRTPREGGTDNPKGHALLRVYDLRLGCAADVWIETDSRHEITLLRDYDRHSEAALTRDKNGLWVVDRALIDARFWDAKKRALDTTMVTRWKDSLVVDHATAQPVAATPVNQGVVSDERIQLRRSPAVWRRITVETDAAQQIGFLTHELDLAPGIVAFLYLRRWDAEKCFDTWKNDFARGARVGRPSHCHRQPGTARAVHSPPGGLVAPRSHRPLGHRRREGTRQTGPPARRSHPRAWAAAMERNRLSLPLQNQSPGAPVLETLLSQKTLSDAL
jgi:hypothetical protein